MSNNEKSQEFNFATEAIEAIREGISPVAAQSITYFTAKVEAGTMVQQIASFVYSSMKSWGKPSVSVALIEKYLEDLVIYRTMQLNDEFPGPVFEKQIPIPDFFFPVLCSLGIFRDIKTAVQITPVYATEEDNDSFGEEEETNAEDECDDDSDEEDAVSGPLNLSKDKFLTVADELERLGVGMTKGLPVGTIANSDGLFRIMENDEGELLVAGPEVTEIELMVRTALDIEFLETLWGQPRTSYFSVENSRLAWKKCVAAGTRKRF